MDFVHYPDEKWFLPSTGDEILVELLDDYTKNIYNPNGELKAKHLLDANAGQQIGACVPFLSSVNQMVRSYTSQ